MNQSLKNSMSNKKPVTVSRKRESKSKLSQHDRVRFECSECNKKFKTNVRLQTHLLSCLKNETDCNENARDVGCKSSQRRESLDEYERANYHRCCNRWYREITGESSDGVSETDRNQTIYERLCEEWSREMDIEQCMIIKRKEMCERMPK